MRNLLNIIDFLFDCQAFGHQSKLETMEYDHQSVSHKSKKRQVTAMKTLRAQI